MNILIVHPCKGFYGGAEEVVAQLCKYLETNGHSVRLITKDNPKELETWIKLPKPESWLGMRSQVQVLSRFYDVVNVHNAPAPLMTFPKKVPTVYMCNEPMELFTNWKRKPIEAFNRWWVKESGMRVVVADSFNARRFKGMYNVIPDIIPYGVDYDFWSKGTRRRHKTFRLLQVGTITPYKNQLESICILAELLASGIDATLTLAGSYTADTKYSNELMTDYIPYIDKEETPGFTKRVTFTGQISQEATRSLLHSHDVLLHPVKDQGGWLAPFEALCAGLPIIVSQEFTGRDVILENKLGMIATDFGQMAKYVCEHYSETLEIAQIQKEWVRDNLTWERFGESIIRALEEAINEATDNPSS